MWLFLLLFACVSNCLQQSIIIDSVRKSELEITEPYIKLNPKDQPISERCTVSLKRSARGGRDLSDEKNEKMEGRT